MLKHLVINILHCDKNLEQNSHIVLIATFLISYIIFNFLFKTNKEDSNITRHKQRQAEDYMRLHEKEDRTFFIGDVEEMDE